ncbi:MAG TPA: ABC transporter ATP-binding protein [Thermoplasmata archaeon]|nr:ABC transporter ATP-binding protein [Thermoplasmata archaeon]
MAMLEVKDLHLYYRTSRGPVKAVDGVSFNLEAGETLALVGESGCGKTSTASAVIRMLPRNVHRYDGSVTFDGNNIMSYSNEKFRQDVRWKGVSIVFQGAMNSLSPVLRVGYQVTEPLTVHSNMSREEARDFAREALKRVRLPDYIADRYPHELSGGMKQRVVIAMALVVNPKIVILDEPTSALDVMTQANIINLLKRLRRDAGLSYIFITHDLALASELADHVAIMYAGKIVEIGPSEDIFRDSKHPYAQRLLSGVPLLRGTQAPQSIPGAPPDLIHPPPGCRFRPRCPFAWEKCEKEPPLEWGSRKAACWLLGEGEARLGGIAA